MRGRPAAGVGVTLERRDADDWVEVSAHATDVDGRVKEMLPREAKLEAADYRLTFDTQSYFHAQKVEGLYPAVQIIFSVREKDGHYHIPLLLTANGYTTYRGS